MSRVAEYIGSRELIYNLAMRELRGKYKRSTLGWTWSLINPLATMVIYTIVFSVFLKVQPTTGDPSGLKSFPLFLLCGLLPWNFLSAGLGSTPQALISNANLIKKVYFPREVAVLSMVIAMFVSFLIEMGVFAIVLLVAGNMILPWLPLALGLMLIEALLVLGFGLILSVSNVFFRDIEHFISIALMALFYSAPIVYPVSVVPVEKQIFGVTIPVREIYELNPIVRMVEAFRSVLYDLRFPSLGSVAYLLAWAIGMLVLGLWVFRKADRRLAEEL
jgi:ABC-2 type transport system permease protein